MARLRIEKIRARASWARELFRPPGINPPGLPGRIFTEAGFPPCRPRAGRGRAVAVGRTRGPD
jgi:hypothetical protein